MPSKVAPYNYNMPPREPPRSASPSSTQKYSTFIDVVLDHVCCASDDNNNSSTRVGSPITVESRQDREHYERRPPQHPLFNQQTLSRSQFASNFSRHQYEIDGRRQDRPESMILPHLRFYPLPTSSAPVSSLRDFFQLFLADDAPHSFQLFHESNGDENVNVTPWRTVHTDISRVDEVRIERTITFHTKITPGSSSNPLSQSEHSNNNSTNVIPLEVTITQNLIQHSKTWILECEFSFDFSPGASISTNSGGVGKKLGTGLGQYLMSNVVKGSTVNVSVTLRECDEIERNSPTHMMTGQSYNARKASMPPPSHASCHDGLLSCLSHPLLLPPDGLCSSTKSSGARKKSKNKKPASVNVDEPSQVGASLLSAIQAKNAPDDKEFDSVEGSDVMGAYLAKTPLVSNRSGVGLSNSDSNRNSEQQTSKKTRGNGADQEQAHQEDVLSCSSRGSLKMKHIPSFELSRSLSTVSMRRMIVEKASSSSNSPLNVPSSSASMDATPASSSPHGLSMRIEMELGSTSNNNLQSTPSTTSSLSSFSRTPSQFSRTPSLASIDDKVRRGLKKRIARSWISWAESWCMRLWEDEEAERARRKALGVAASESNKRTKVNVRPSVRKIGDPKKVKSSNSSSSSTSRKKKAVVLPPKDVWKPVPSEKSSNGRNVRWMSLEQEGECGVEVAYALPLTPMQSVPMGADPKEQGGTKTKIKRRLLKSLSSST